MTEPKKLGVVFHAFEQSKENVSAIFAIVFDCAIVTIFCHISSLDADIMYYGRNGFKLLTEDNF